MKELIDRTKVIELINNRKLHYLKESSPYQVITCEMLEMRINNIPADDSIERIREFVKNNVDIFIKREELLNFIDNEGLK